MADLGLCAECGGEVKLTPKNGNCAKHKRKTPGNSGVFEDPPCKGSGKLPKLWRPATCDACGTRVRLMVDGKLSKHFVEGGAQCVSSLKEAAATLVEELGAVEVKTDDSSSSSTSSETSADLSSKPGTPPSSIASPPSTPPTSPVPSSSVPAQPLPTDTTGGAAPSSAVPASAPTSPSPPASGTPQAPSWAEAVSDEPKPKTARRSRQPLKGEALAVSEWFDEMFFAYQHARPRSLQPTIGPSGAGSKCMRKIAMKLSQMPEVNFDKDSYAAWFGTQGHEGLERMLEWANSQFHVPRFLIEAALEFGSTVMPHGHNDCFDRRKHRVIDWKFPGESALGKMHLDGCPEDYETQLHLYGYALRLAGETVEEVCLIALPRERGDLSKKYVFVTDYDEDKAVAAIKKVEAIDARLKEYGEGGWRKAPKTTSFLCTYCPFYLPGDKAEAKGCSA